MESAHWHTASWKFRYWMEQPRWYLCSVADMETASSVMFLLGIGEILEEWTHKKSVADLARSMSLHVEKVWRSVTDRRFLFHLNQIEPGDKVIVRMGNMVPFDGVVVTGDGMVNQSLYDW